jgi:hypothetical protein
MSDPIIEAAARALCRAEGTAQCAAICLSHFASSTSDGKCPEALLVWKHKSEATIAAVTPLIELNALSRSIIAPQIRNAALEEAATAAENHAWGGYQFAAAIRALKEQP